MTPPEVLDYIEALLDEMPVDEAIKKAADHFGLTFKEMQDYLEIEFLFYSGI